MRLTIHELKRLIRESLDHTSETFFKDISDDDAFKQRSVFVPDDIKIQIRRWLKKMKLSPPKR